MPTDPDRPGPAGPPAADEPKAEGPFAQRGYYITFMRMPTYDLADWKRIVDGIHDDGGNTLLLWVAGAFRSKKYPITWRYNAEHENVRKDFVRDLIDHAHARGIKVLLGFTPFGYDGVNQYPLEHPELRRSARTASRSPRSASAAGATTSARRGPSRRSSCWNTSGRWPSTSTRTPTAC